MKPNIHIEIAGLTLKNPVIVASGTFGYGEEFHSDIYDISLLGAVVTKGISLKPRKGNPMPRVVETAGGMLNAIGLNNVGIEVFIRDKLPFLRKAKAKIIVNVFGETVANYVAIAEQLNDATGVDAIELNISCPNVGAEGLQFGVDPRLAAEVTGAVRRVTQLPLIVKLSPQASDIPAMSRAIADAGADALSVINTIPAMAIDVKRRRPVLANITGGLSGPAIKPIALRMVWEASRAVKIPIIGIGGIMNTTDAIEFFLAGASAIQVGTANFVKPHAALEIIEGIEAYFVQEGITDISKIIGAIIAKHP